MLLQRTIPPIPRPIPDAAERAPRRAELRLPVKPPPHESREALIASLAYALAESRGFTPGHEIDDWLQAETWVDERLAGEGRAY